MRFTLGLRTPPISLFWSGWSLVRLQLREKEQGYYCGVAAIQLRGACNVYGGEVRVRKMQWPARLEGPARIAAVCGKVSYSLGSARCAF